MRKYRLKIKYPNIFQKNEIGDIVYYNSLTKNYVKAEAPHYSVSAYDVENYPDFWELIEEKEPLFITDDDIGVLNKEALIYIVNKNFYKKETELCNIYDKSNREEFKYFFHESNADEYIWKNKPLFSYEDFMRWGNVPYERVIKQLAKERIMESKTIDKL